MKASDLLKWVVGIVLIIILVGIALSNYTAGIYLAVGAGALIVIGSSFYFGGWKGLLVLVGIAGCFGVGLLGFAFLTIRPMANMISICNEGDKHSVMEITAYSAVIEPVDFKEGTFQIAEHVIYQEMEETCKSNKWESELVQENLEADLPVSTIQGVESGMFMHDVTIPVQPEGFECCPDSASVEIKDIPFNSFYDAQYADDLSEDEYLGNVSITWKTSRLGEGIRFAYLPAPFNSLRVVVTPLIELSKNDNWVLTGIGFGFSGIIIAAMKGFAIDLVKDGLKKKLKKKEDSLGKKPPALN